MRDGIKRRWVDGKRMFEKSSNKKELKGLKRAAYRLETKIKNMISDIHKKTAKFLCDNYDTVIIPVFRSQRMTERRDSEGRWKRKIGKGRSRRLMR